MRKVLFSAIAISFIVSFSMTSVSDDDKNTIEFSISTYKETFMIYEPIFFKFRLRNNGEKPVYINPNLGKMSASLTVSFSRDGGKTYEVCRKPSEFVPFSLEGVPNRDARKIAPGDFFVIEDSRYLISPQYVYGSLTRHTFDNPGTYHIKAVFTPRQDHAILFLENKGKETTYVETTFESMPFAIKVEEHKMSDEEKKMLADDAIVNALGMGAVGKQETEKVKLFIEKFPKSHYAPYLDETAIQFYSKGIDQRIREVLHGEKNSPNRSYWALSVAKDMWQDSSVDTQQKRRKALEWIQTVEKGFSEMSFTVKEEFEELKKKIQENENPPTPR